MFSNMEPRSSNEIIEPRVNFEEIPISALRQRSRGKLSVLLNPEKVLVTEDGHNRDWRGLFALSGLDQSEYSLISQTDDKVAKLLDLWNRKNDENKLVVSISQLQQCFEIIDRYDAYDDTYSMFGELNLEEKVEDLRRKLHAQWDVEDSQAYLTKSQTRQQSTDNNLEIIKREPENDLITTKDVEYREQGLELPIYDAFVIYSDKDIEFATELIERLENKGYNLCAKDRDLLPGLTFESDAILSLLSKRCNRLIIIVSKAFLESPMQLFITNYAQALGIEKGEGKIIPCVLEPGCNLPQMMRFCYRLDYFKNSKLFDFWEKLNVSLRINAREMKGSASGDKLSTDKITSAKQIETSSSQKELVYNFSQVPKTPEKSSKRTSLEDDTQKPTPIMPPPRKLRSASSLVSLNTSTNNHHQKNKTISQSTLELNGECSMEMTQSTKLKRKKWYRMFMPKDTKVKSSDAGQNEENDKKRKSHWFKGKKKQKEKLAVLAES